MYFEALKDAAAFCIAREYPSGVVALLAIAGKSGLERKALGVSGVATGPLPAGCGAQSPSRLRP